MNQFNLMYASSSLTPMSVKPWIKAEKDKFDFFYKMGVDMFHYVDTKLKMTGHPLIPGKDYYIDNMPHVRNYVDESHWILMRGKYIGPAAFPGGGPGNTKGREFSNLTYVYISDYNDKDPLTVDTRILPETWCRFTFDPDQPSEADMERHRTNMALLRLEFDAMRAEPVDSPATNSGIYNWIGEEYRAARDRQTHQEQGAFAPSSAVLAIRAALPYTSQAQKKKAQKKKAQKKKAQKMKKSKSQNNIVLKQGGSLAQCLAQ